MLNDDTWYIGKNMPLTISKNMFALDIDNGKEIYVLNQDRVFFDSYDNPNYTADIHYFIVRTENGERLKVNNQEVKFTHLPFDVKQIDQSDIVSNLEDITVGQNVITLFAEESNIGSGLVVKVLATEKGEDIDRILVENQWGGRDYVFVGEVVKYDQNKIYNTIGMTKERALDIAIEAMNTLKVSTKHFKARKDLDDAIKMLQQIK